MGSTMLSRFSSVVSRSTVSCFFALFDEVTEPKKDEDMMVITATEGNCFLMESLQPTL